MMKIILIVNRKEHIVQVELEEPLLWVLRDKLHLTGTKYSCGKGLCGSCTVLVNGMAIRSCITPASSVVGKQITTIEGLSLDSNHPVQKAWEEIDVPQCGYCQSGQIMNAVALLNSNPKPNDEEINQAMQGNICRCGTYPKIKAAIKLAAKKGDNND